MLWSSRRRTTIVKVHSSLGLTRMSSLTRRKARLYSDTLGTLGKTILSGRRMKTLHRFPDIFLTIARSASRRDTISSCNASLMKSPACIVTDGFLADWAEMVSSSAHVIHADFGYGNPRCVPQMLIRGPYNTWGYDRGVPANMEHQSDGTWELELYCTHLDV
jgi:hypothetical protein